MNKFPPMEHKINKSDSVDLWNSFVLEGADGFRTALNKFLGAKFCRCCAALIYRNSEFYGDTPILRTVFCESND